MKPGLTVGLSEMFNQSEYKQTLKLKNKKKRCSEWIPALMVRVSELASKLRDDLAK